MRMGECEEVTRCRLCGASRLTDVLDLGNQPLANRLAKAENKDAVKWYPLRLARCEACKLVQLRHSVPQSEVLQGSYAQRDGAAVVDGLRARNLVSLGDVVLDVGCGDGSLVAAWGKDYHAIGTEANKRAAAAAASRGVAVHHEAFTEAAASEFADDYGGARVVTAMGTLSQQRDPNAFLRACASVLRGDGRLVLEVPDWSQAEESMTFDVMDHRTQSWFTARTLFDALRRNGLRMVEASLDPGTGTLHAEAVQDSKTAASGSVSSLLAAKPGDRDMQAAFNALRNDIRETVEAFDRVAGYGSLEQATVLTNACGLDADDIGWVSPPHPQEVEPKTVLAGSWIPVLPVNHFDAKPPEIVIALPGEAVRGTAIQRGALDRYRGKYLFPIPHAEVV